jgi:exodeoxyribonuclease V alpha subunit
VVALRAGDSVMTIMDALMRFRVLCVHREGARGISLINRRIEALLRRSLSNEVVSQGDWHSGRAVVITRNDYNLRLFNGDVGVALPDLEAGGALRVFFEDSEGGVRAIAPARLPAWELAFAMTVHKSQGAEFDRVLLVLPETASSLVTRELLYTAITRARKEVRVFGAASVFAQGVSVGQSRDSGLAERLWT